MATTITQVIANNINITKVEANGVQVFPPSSTNFVVKVSLNAPNGSSSSGAVNSVVLHVEGTTDKTVTIHYSGNAQAGGSSRTVSGDVTFNGSSIVQSLLSREISTGNTGFARCNLDFTVKYNSTSIATFNLYGGKSSGYLDLTHTVNKTLGGALSSNKPLVHIKSSYPCRKMWKEVI